jgi:hypothetical protein
MTSQLGAVQLRAVQLLGSGSAYWAKGLLAPMLSAARLQEMSALSTVSELATGAGTLVLAVATFASVRSANRSARVAEDTMLAAMRPILMNTRHQDGAQKLSFQDDIWLVVPGGGAAVKATGDVIYLGISLRNVGTGMGILHGWRIRTGIERPPLVRPELADFRPQTRDLYISPADMGFWEGALRDPAEPLFGEVAAAIQAEDSLSIDLLYGDFQGGQRVITRFRVLPSPWAERDPSYRPGAQANRAQPEGAQSEGAQSDGAQSGGALFAQPEGGIVTRIDAPPAHEDVPGTGPAAGGAPRSPHPLPESSTWVTSAVRHWNVDRPDPR